MGRSAAWRLAQLGALLFAAGTAYQLLAPATINGDGVGYLKQVQEQALAPGHLAYLPLVRAIAACAPGATLIELAKPLRLLSLGAGLLGIALLYLTALRLAGHRQALFAAALLAVSHAHWRAAHEVEVYGVSALLVIATLFTLISYRAAPPGGQRTAWALACGLLAGAAVHFHLTLALLALPVLVLLFWWGRSTRQLLLAVAATALMVMLPLLVALHSLQIASVAEAWSWLRSSDHGLPYPLSAATPLIALWGLTKSLVFAPYPYEASLLRVALLTTAGALAWIALIALARRAGAPRRELGIAFLAAWSAPLLLFGVLFYPSDTERWVFLMPAIALVLAPASGRLAVATLAAVALLNGVALLPAARDDAAPRRAAAVDRALGPTDLVVSPGHGWEELIGLGSHAPPAVFPLIYYVGAHRDADAAIREMHARIASALAGGGRALVARLKDDADPRGFKELRWRGISPQGFAALFERYRPRPSELPGLWQLSLPGSGASGQ